MNLRVVLLALVVLALLGGGGFYIARLARRTPASVTPEAEREARTRLNEAALQPAKGESQSVTLYFPSFTDGKLVPESRSLKLAATDADRARQILLALAEGSQEGRSPVLPPSTAIRAVFLTADGSAYIDFSREGLGDFMPGIESETLAVYSMVDSLTGNIPAIKRVKFLVEGQEVDTLEGHVDLTGFFVADPTRIEGGP